MSNTMTIQIKGYVRMEQQEEFEAWEKEQLAKQEEYRKQAEKETNEWVKNNIKKNGRTYPSYDEQDSNFLNNPNY